MKKTPLWKVKREVKRLFRQLLELPGVIYEYLFLRVLVLWLFLCVAFSLCVVCVCV